jgi:preprotein translocase subunit SecA
MFSAMMDAIKEESVGYVFNADVQQAEPDQAEDEAAAEHDADHHAEVLAKGLDAPRRPAQLQYSAPSLDGDSGAAVTSTESSGDGYEGTARNAPCPCGSGKKYKRCHGDPKVRASS